MEKKIFFAKNNFRDWKTEHFSLELNFASAIKSNISRFQTFANLPKIAKSRNFVSQKFLTLKYFGHGQYFVWEFSVLAFIETVRLNTTSFRFFPDPEMTPVWPISYVCQVCKLKLFFWTIFVSIVSYLQPLYSELYFSILYGDCGNFCFLRKIFSKSYYIYVSFLSRNQ